MFSIAILIGIYSYLIFGIGLAGLLYRLNIILATFLFGLVVTYFYRKRIRMKLLQSFKRLKRIQMGIGTSIMQNKLLALCLLILILQGLINFIGVLGPELGFDALWYHLTLPKIYLINHSISYVSGGLFYYSVMPKLTEMLYVAGLAFGSEIVAKFIHFSFGVLCLIALYKLSRKLLSKNFSLLVLVLFYSNLVVGWMSITAYIDLARTFFEIMALWGFVNFTKKKENKWLILSAVLLGLAISTKLLALGSLLIFSILIIIFTRKATNALTYCFFSLFIPLPWFIFSLINTGNPVYPFFSSIYPVKLNVNLINPLTLSDPISPLYLLFLPIVAFFYKKLNLPLKIITIYSFLAFLVWQLTPNTGGGRFILPYLPAFSLITIVVIEMIKKIKLRYLFIGAIVVLSLFSILYRGTANSKYISLILGRESKTQFLSNHLNFLFGDYYDTDGYFKHNIKQTDKVLLYGFHNLYYVNFPFIDSSYVKKGDVFNYIAVQGIVLPERFKYWNLVYYNNKTNLKLYSAGGLRWIY